MNYTKYLENKFSYHARTNIFTHLPTINISLYYHRYTFSLYNRKQSITRFSQLKKYIDISSISQSKTNKLTNWQIIV